MKRHTVAVVCIFAALPFLFGGVSSVQHPPPSIHRKETGTKGRHMQSVFVKMKVALTAALNRHPNKTQQNKALKGGNIILSCTDTVCFMKTHIYRGKQAALQTCTSQEFLKTCKIQVISCTVPKAHHTPHLCFSCPSEDHTEQYAYHVNR